MDKENQPCTGHSGSKVLHNTGGPRSRVRSEKVSEYYLSPQTDVDKGCYAINIPQSVDNIEAWLLGMGKQMGWEGWDDINRCIGLPTEKLMAFNEPLDEIQTHLCDKVSFLRNAIILSMCNQFCYLPNGPRIFTRSRLERKIKLTKINIKNFYELE